jgi:DNA-directed RNA polymerase specialized sigma24 family protein
LVVLKDSLSNLALPDVPLAGAPAQQADVARVRQQQKRLRPEEIERLVARYAAGATTYQLAVEFGCHRTTVSGALRRAGIHLQPGGLTEKQIDKAIRLYEFGLSLQRVADQIGSTAHTVRSRLIERGTEMRDTHGRRVKRRVS